MGDTYIRPPAVDHLSKALLLLFADKCNFKTGARLLTFGFKVSFYALL